MEFDWLDTPFDLKKVSPKEIEESFEDPFSLRLLPTAWRTMKSPLLQLGQIRQRPRHFYHLLDRRKNATARSFPAT